MVAHARRTWPQRLVLLLSTTVTVGALVAAALVWYANDQLGRVQRVEIVRGTAAPLSVGPGETIPPTTLDLSGSIEARNFLIVGSDSRTCIDADSPYAGAFLADDVAGERSDTIALLRVDPEERQAALLSFPRDLWVSIGDSNRKSRINSAFDGDDPSLLVRTIERNFGVPVHHYLEVDFCAFKFLVDAIGGVDVPFAYPTRDENTGLNITQPGCERLDGEKALAYARSRHYEYLADGDWQQDGTGDRGRIARQQDFMRRALQRAIDRGAFRPDIAKQLIDIGLERVRLDSELSVGDLLKVASRLRDFDAKTILTYRLDGRDTTVGGAAVIRPVLDDPNTEAVLSIFRGEARLAEAPAPGDLAPVDPATTTTPPTPGGAPPADGAPAEVVVEENTVGIVPPDDPSCG